MKLQSKSHLEEWSRISLYVVTSWIVFESISGLAILLLPFSVSNQVFTLVHTLIGVLVLIPYAIYQLRHWKIYKSWRMTHVVLTGYMAMVATLVAIVSGVVLTVQAIWVYRISKAWDMVHILSTVLLLASVTPHIVTMMIRSYKARANKAMALMLQKQKSFVFYTSVYTGLFFLLVLVFTVLYQPENLNNQLPEDYSYLYGPDRPFAPSLAQTSTGNAFDARSLGGSESCGRAGCHSEIYKEWSVSAHRYSAMDPAFRAVQKTMGEQNGAESTRYCGGCHDPISLFSGTKNLFRDDLTSKIGLDEGISCVTCHAIKETDVKGNANYTVEQPDRYMFAYSENTFGRAISDFLLRAYPKKHVASLQHTLFKSPEFCAACHKQFIDKEINNVGWVQLQNQYDNWRKSRWNHPGDPEKTIECRECHMPLQDSFDPANGDAADYNRTADDKKHRSHRFLGANQFVPAHLKLEGADEQVKLTRQWLRGEIEIPEIADKWKNGPAIPIQLVVPESVSPGQSVKIDVINTNNKVGHEFPTGPLDIIQAWVEVVVTDENGNEVYVSGRRDSSNFVQTGSFMFKAEPVDQFGKLIDKHNLWEMVGVRYKRAMYPGFSDRARFEFACPASLTKEVQPLPEREHVQFKAPAGKTKTLHVKARLLYRKVDQYLLNTLFGPDSGLTAPVAVLSEDEKTITVKVS